MRRDCLTPELESASMRYAGTKTSTLVGPIISYLTALAWFMLEVLAPAVLDFSNNQCNPFVAQRCIAYGRSVLGSHQSCNAHARFINAPVCAPVTADGQRLSTTRARPMLLETGNEASLRMK